MKKRWLNNERLLGNTIKHWQLLVLALPAIILLILFNYVPLSGLILAFKKYNYIKGIYASDWAGIENFRFLLQSKDLTVRLFRNTVCYWAIITLVNTSLSLFIAIVLNECKHKFCSKITQTVMIFPTFISWIAVAFVVKAFLQTEGGMVNNILATMGIEGVNWYADPGKWPVIIPIVAAWKAAGYGSIIYLSALAGMDESVMEAAEIDGATRWQKIRYITLPMLTSIISIQLLISLGTIMSSNTGLFYQVTRQFGNGALVETTQTIDAYILSALGDGNTNYGITSAVTFFQSAISAILVICVNLIVRRRDPDNALF